MIHRAGLIGGWPNRALADDFGTSPAVIDLTAGRAAARVFRGVLIRFSWPCPFGEINSVISQNRTLATMDQSNCFVVLSQSCIECEFRLGTAALSVESDVQRLNAGFDQVFEMLFFNCCRRPAIECNLHHPAIRSHRSNRIT